jgi:hypothetical protein
LEEGKIGSLPRSMQNFEGRFRLGGLACIFHKRRKVA